MANEPSRKYFSDASLDFERAAAEAREDVGGDGTHLQADESGDEFIGAGKNAHPRRGEQNQRVVFAALDAFLVEIVERAQNRQSRRDDHDHVQKNAESVGAESGRCRR